ncbi:SLC26A/SulP transporter family protein [Spirochaeta africana]|uniref:Sulfate permease-like transporter, MFS superfamily n=1 Tax=Spirochaeta africana (strain ATCC 700263 / DSM 8902 / Z-7692) TaxID=889378 RepID=H9ULE7_SPIAZ|nr:SulP family inorganic anion transporter [Spirochaeta africana]AFG38340.1 sulfate permease-like transporter, MFS superfamily [Spirochaeta africana DSM 8902]
MNLPSIPVSYNLAGAGSRWAAEITAGITVACIALPLALAFGVTAYGPLGSGYGALGAAAGLTGAALTGLLASLFGGCRPQVTGPTGPMSMAARGAIASLIGVPAIAALPAAEQAPAVILLFSVSVVLGGGVQWLMAWSRLGNLVRGIPYPVVAGFMNGVSVLIILDQLPPALGIDAWRLSATGLLPAASPEAVPAMLSAAAAALTAVLLPRAAAGARRGRTRIIASRLPAPLLALILGSGVYFLTAALLQPQLLTVANPQLVGPIPAGVPLPRLLLDIGSWLPLLGRAGIPGIILQQALVLGLLGIIDTLLTSVIADLKTGERHNSDRELYGQGLGNIAAGLFGALPGAGATVRTLANIEAGGRTGLSGMTHAAILLGSLLLFGPLVQWIPLPVLAALMVVLAVRMVDYWSIELLRKRSARSDSLVLWLVTAVTVAADLIIALSAGMVLAALLFVRRQTALGIDLHSSDRRYLKSRVIHSETDEQALAENGRDIRILQVAGSLFFGSADDIIGRMEQQLSGARIAVLDLHRLRNLDLTGGKMLLDLLDRLQHTGSSLYLGGLSTASQAGRFLQELGLGLIISADRLLPDGDLALQQAEAERLADCGFCSERIQPAELDFLAALQPPEQQLLLPLLQQRSLSPGQILYHAGDPGHEISFILNGLMEIRGSLYGDTGLASPDRAAAGHRVAAYGTGQHLGLTAWLERRPHAYTARAIGKVELACIDGEQLHRLLELHPSLGLHLLEFWSRQLAGRVRRSWEREIHSTAMADV